GYIEYDRRPIGHESRVYLRKDLGAVGTAASRAKRERRSTPKARRLRGREYGHGPPCGGPLVSGYCPVCLEVAAVAANWAVKAGAILVGHFVPGRGRGLLVANNGALAGESGPREVVRVAAEGRWPMRLCTAGKRKRDARRERKHDAHRSEHGEQLLDPRH